MFSQVLAVSTLLALAAAGVIPQVHYSPAEAVSSQSIIRHDHPAVATNLVHPPAAKLTVATPVFHAAPTAVTYATSPIAYHASPIQYSPAHIVSSQSILHHDHPLPTLATKLVATPVTKIAVAAPVQYASAPFQYTPVTKVVAPVTKVIQPARKVLVSENRVDEFVHPKYEFSYSVDDEQSGDHKSQHEIRDGDIVQGHYTMLEADGTIRRVDYTSDGDQGFNAVVSHSAPTHPHSQSNQHPHSHPESIILN